MKEYIERESLRRSINPWLDGTILVMPVRALDEAPAADVEPVRHGEWVEHGNWFGHIEYECTSCGDTTFDASEMCYCPWCGAKMDGGKE